MKGLLKMKFEKYELKSGEVKWKFYHYLGINPDTGKKDYIQRQGFNTQSEARNALLKIINQYENNQNIKKTHNNQYLFDEVTKLWLMHYEKQVKITTYATTTSYLRNHILPQFKDYYINRINVRQCQEAINLWYATYTEASLLASITSRIFKFGINQGFCSDNPIDKVIRPKNTHKKEYKAPFYAKEELLQFLQAVKADESIRAYTMFHLLAFTGLRRGELFGLQWRDIDFQRKTLSVERTLIYNQFEKKFKFSTPKTKNSQREIGIDQTTIQNLLKWRNYQREFFLARGVNVHSDEQLIFTSQNNHYMTDAYLRRIIKRITKKYNLPHITVHGFRHTHCSLLFEMGTEIQNVKDRLGHSDIKTTMNIYTHVTDEKRTETADLFGDFMQESNFI